MDHYQLLNFLKVCEEKSITSAAKKCFITPQGLSNQIKQLENEFDAQLFYRYPHGLELTEFGRTLHDAALRYCNYHNDIVDSIKRQKEKKDTYLSVGIKSGVYTLLPDNFFKDFLTQHPDTVFKLRSFDGDNCRKGMLEYNIHLGFCNEPIEDTDSLFDVFPFQKYKTYIIMGNGHHLAGGGTSITIPELKNESLIVYDDILRPYNILEKFCEHHGIMPAIYINAFEIGLIYELCSTNRFIAFWAGPFENSFSGLVAMELSDVDLQWDFNFLVQKDVIFTKTETAFIQYAKDRLGIIDP
jgi:DNA-binding transcriptional LysR family regulator